MSFTSLSFIGIYFPLLLVAYYNPVFRGNTFRKLILIAASLGLYAFSQPAYVLLLMAVILYNFLLVKLADKTGRDLFRAVSVVLDVLVLLGFKTVSAFLPFTGAHGELTRLAFPVGLSYFTFKAISYVVDSRSEKRGSLLDAAIYVSNFLTITSGPLSFYADELPFIREKRRLGENAVYRGAERFILGLAKKVIIADSLGVLVKMCFAASHPGAVMAWAGAIAYTLQLFFDFSGYTDMALGTGILFGFELPENFNCPYMASSVCDFWKRWHISLTRWFTKYIYFPLGGSRVKTAARHIFNLFAVWFATGIWHGSSLTFMIWAMIYFALQLLEKYTKWADLVKKAHMGHIYTLLAVVIEWVIFRSGSVPSALHYLKSMFLLNGNAVASTEELSLIARFAVPFVLGIIFSADTGVKIKNLAQKNTAADFLYHFGLIAMFAVCIVITIGQGYSAPLYAGF